MITIKNILTLRHLTLLLFTLLIAVWLLNLNKVPLFGDETFYLYWADELLNNPNTFLNSLNYGAMPTLIWIMSIFHLFIQNPETFMILSRGLIVMSTLLSGFFIYLIAKKLFNQTTAILSTIIFLTLPLTFFHGRVISTDSPSNLAVLVAIYMLIVGLDSKLILKKISFKWIYSFAGIILLSFFIKPIVVAAYPAIFSLPLLYLTKKDFKKQIKFIVLNVGLGSSVAGLVGYLLFLPISGKYFNWYVAEKSNSLNLIIESLKMNLFRVKLWLISYITLPTLLIILFNIFFLILKQNKKILWLFFWLFSVIFIISYNAVNLFPRYLFHTAAPLSLLAGFAFYQFISFNKKIGLIIITLIICNQLLSITAIAFSPKTAQLIPEDKLQFYENWTSGVGHQEISIKLNEISSIKPINLVIENETCQKWAFIKRYPIKNANIYTSTNLHVGAELEKEIIQKIQENNLETYVVVNKLQQPPLNLNTKLIYSQPKGSYRNINLYKANP